MKTMGLLEGMSWESSLEYYRAINQLVKKRLGGLHSAKCLMYSVDFHEIETLQQQAMWDEAGAILGAAAKALQRGGADFLLICTNTMQEDFYKGKLVHDHGLEVLTPVDADMDMIHQVI